MLPWKETSAELERLRFIRWWKEGEESVTELCRQFGISRKTAYKMIARYRRVLDSRLLLVTGAVSRYDGAANVIASRVQALPTHVPLPSAHDWH